MIKVSDEVPVYEINDTEATGLERPTISVQSHWNRDAFVVLVVDGKRYTVTARDLQAATNNATNSARAS